jgi:DNA adenine methylase
MPQPIPYQGSKRNIAVQILNYFPPGIDCLIEPFAGSAAISVAAAYLGLAQKFHLNDRNAPLAHLLQLVITQPTTLAAQYQELWTAQLGQERVFYDQIRAEFNQTHRPELLLYLLARCVKASIRYNTNGEFNQSPDNRRRGRHPSSMRQELVYFSQLLDKRTIVTNFDFREITAFINPKSDLVYLDPPYQGTSGTRDSRYQNGVDYCELVAHLKELNALAVMFALSYDGIKGDKTYGVELPRELQLHKVFLNAGRSTQSTLLGRNDTTYEALYLSKPLMARLGLSDHWRADKRFQAPMLPTPTPQLQLELPYHS